jgi:hypothetical protein
MLMLKKNQDSTLVVPTGQPVCIHGTNPASEEDSRIYAIEDSGSNDRYRLLDNRHINFTEYFILK